MSERFSYEMAADDVCPRCLGDLDTGWECSACGYDAFPLIRDSRFLPELTAAELAAMEAMPPVGECLPHWKAGEVWRDGQWMKGRG